MPWPFPARRLGTHTSGATLEAMRVHHRLGRVVGFCLVAALAAGCTSDGGGPGNRPTPGDPSGTDASTQGQPFDLDIHRIRLVNADNAEIVGGRPTPVDHGAAERAVEACRAKLEAFLNAQFVDEGTWFSEAPLAQLLTPRAQASLTAADRAGLGVIAPDVARTFTGPTSAVAQVVIEGSKTHLVHLWYATKLTVELADGTTSAVDQRGSVTFSLTGDGWRAQAVDVDLTLPDVPGQPAPEAGA